MTTTNPVPSNDPTDLLFNAQKLDEVVNGAAQYYTDRLGVNRRTVEGISAAADVVLGGLGYAPPVTYASGISMTLTTQTVEYSGEIYAPKVASLPFTTSTWATDSAKFRLIQGVAATDLAAGSGAALVGYMPVGINAIKRTIEDKLHDIPTSKNFVGVDPTGVLDSTVGLQNWINYAWDALFYASPWSGSGPANPVLQLHPGRYRITDTLVLPTGCVIKGMGHPANTTSHTRIIMDSTATVPGGGSGDNRNKPIFKFNRATRNAAALANSMMTSTIQELEFWYVTMGNNFDTPLSGAGIPWGDYLLGGTLFFDVDAGDFRVVDCVFQHSPAAVRIKDVGLTPATRPDGFIGNHGVGIFFENCEFDAGTAHVYATNSWLDLQFKNCQFYGGVHRYEACSGNVVYQGGRWHGNAWIDAGNYANSFSRFTLTGADIELPSSTPMAFINKSTIVSIKGNTLTGAGGSSGFVVTDAEGGAIDSNTINNSGYNASAGTGVSNYVAAIKMIGCRNVGVMNNNITASASASYNGFGILSVDSDRSAQYNFVSGNSVSAPYNGAAFNGQDRYINLVAADIRGSNYNAHSSQSKQIARFTGGLNVQGIPIADNSGPLGSAYSLDMNTTLIEDGVYLVIAESYPTSNFAALSTGAYLFYKRAAGGGTLVDLGTVNSSTTGQISKSGTSIAFNYDGANQYKIGIYYHKISKAAVD